MILTRVDQQPVQTSQNPVFTIFGPNTLGITIFLENLDTTNYIQYQFASAQVNLSSSYTFLTDVGGNFGSSGILTPVGGGASQAMVSIRVTDPYIRLLASGAGGATVRYSVHQFVSTSSTNYTNGVL